MNSEYNRMQVQNRQPQATDQRLNKLNTDMKAKNNRFQFKYNEYQKWYKQQRDIIIKNKGSQNIEKVKQFIKAFNLENLKKQKEFILTEIAENNDEVVKINKESIYKINELLDQFDLTNHKEIDLTRKQIINNINSQQFGVPVKALDDIEMRQQLDQFKINEQIGNEKQLEIIEEQQQDEEEKLLMQQEIFKQLGEIDDKVEKKIDYAKFMEEWHKALKDESNFIPGFKYWDSLIFIADSLLLQQNLINQQQFEDSLRGLKNKNGVDMLTVIENIKEIQESQKEDERELRRQKESALQSEFDQQNLADLDEGTPDEDFYRKELYDATKQGNIRNIRRFLKYELEQYNKQRNDNDYSDESLSLEE